MLSSFHQWLPFTLTLLTIVAVTVAIFTILIKGNSEDRLIFTIPFLVFISFICRFPPDSFLHSLTTAYISFYWLGVLGILVLIIGCDSDCSFSAYTGVLMMILSLFVGTRGDLSFNVFNTVSRFLPLSIFLFKIIVLIVLLILFFSALLLLISSFEYDELSHFSLSIVLSLFVLFVGYKTNIINWLLISGFIAFLIFTIIASFIVFSELGEGIELTVCFIPVLVILLGYYFQLLPKFLSISYVKYSLIGLLSLLALIALVKLIFIFFGRYFIDIVRTLYIKTITLFASRKALKEISLNNTDYEFRQEAVKKLTDQECLEEIATSRDYSTIRSNAMRKISKKSVLIDIANDHFEDCDIREMALSELSDNFKSIYKLTEKNIDHDFGEEEKQKPTPQNELEKILKSSEYIIDDKVQAVTTVHNKTLLLKTALFDKNIKIRVAALSNLVFQINTTLLNFLGLHISSSFNKENITTVQNQSLLVKLVNDNSVNYETREIAITQLIDRLKLMEIANSPHKKFSMLAFDKLTSLIGNDSNYFTHTYLHLLDSFNKEVRLGAAKLLISIAKKDPNILLSNWGEICQKINSTHVDSHYDHSSYGECFVSHTDKSSSIGIGLSFPQVPPDEL